MKSMNKFLSSNSFKRHVLALMITAIGLLSTPDHLSYAQNTNLIYTKNITEPLATHSISLEKRFLDSEYVSDIMADNILLNLAYLNNDEINPINVDWEKVRKLKRVEFTLQPDEVFAFHNDALPQYQQFVKTTNAHFNASEGFKSDGYLYGDGVCHLASLMYWVAKDSGLEAFAPKDHNFAVIPEVPAEYGVAIYYLPGSKELNSNRNLYIKNTLDKPVTFIFSIENSTLELEAIKGQ
jgi:hypothetical protein